MSERAKSLKPSPQESLNPKQKRGWREENAQRGDHPPLNQGRRKDLIALKARDEVEGKR